MKAIVCEKPFALTVEARQDPAPNPGEVLIRIQRVGLCGTDFHIFAGNQPFLEYPRIMGHELAGYVQEVREGSAFRVGQLVTVNPYLACGTCIACRRNKPNCCTAIQVLGVHIDGGMCDLIAVPESSLVDASGLTVDQAAMVEFLAIGAHAVRRAAPVPGDRILVVGSGPIGIAAALFAQLAGAEVTLTDTREPRLRYAADHLGLVQTVIAGGEAMSRFHALTNGDMFDCVFDATGNVAAMRGGLDYVAHGGTYVLISVVKDEIAFSDPEFHKRETTLLASRNALPEDFDQVIARIRDGTIPTDALNTHRLSADDAPDHIPMLIEDADNVLKAIVAF